MLFHARFLAPVTARLFVVSPTGAAPARNALAAKAQELKDWMPVLGRGRR